MALMPDDSNAMRRRAVVPSPRASPLAAQIGLIRVVQRLGGGAALVITTSRPHGARVHRVSDSRA